MADVRRVPTARGPIDARVAVPGSKSIANRALVCAALADGVTHLSNVPDGDDTVAMVAALSQLGVTVDAVGDELAIVGAGGRLGAHPVRLDARLAGTTSRFLTALAALGSAPITIDGARALRARPMGPLHAALADLGVEVAAGDAPGHLPVTITGPPAAGRRLALPGDVSSQYVTALMLVAPHLPGGLDLELTSDLVSRPYVELTATVMAAFGVEAVGVGTRRITVAPGRYRATTLPVEPDASSASYPLAIAAVVGGRVEIAGLTAASRQGDVAFVELLDAMGCTTRLSERACVVARDPAVPLGGIDVDMAAISDLVPTVAAVAVTAASPTRIGGVGFIRAKESDRLGDLATELVKTGAAVAVEPDGLRIQPVSGLHGARLATHDDHRLAMAFGVLGAVVDGIEVEHPDVVGKSWPGYWAARDAMVGAS
jgi:3-phosphoshikimate 1-carboxyvinyltransferase